MSSQRFSITGKHLDETITTSMIVGIVLTSLVASFVVMLLGHYNPKFVQEKNTPSGCNPRPSYFWLAMTVLLIAVIAIGILMCFGQSISKRMIKFMKN